MDILRALAEKLNHLAAEVLNDTLFVFYTQDVNSSESEEERLERYEIEGLDYRRFFSSLKKLVPDFRAVALFDSDGKMQADELCSSDFHILRWKRYEIENYFITPELLARYMKINHIKPSAIRQCLDKVLADMVFEGDVSKVGEYYSASRTIQAKLLSNVKMSRFAEKVFLMIAHTTKTSILLNKGEYYRLIPLLAPEEVPQEVHQRLDELLQMLDNEDTPSENTPSENTLSEDTPSEDTLSEDTPSENTPSAKLIIRLLEVLNQTEMSSMELLVKLGLHDRKGLRLRYISPAIKAGYVEHCQSSPRANNQTYRLTEKGREFLQCHQSEN